MSLHDRILNLACNWQASNFDIKREVLEMQLSPQSSYFFPSRKRSPSPPSRPSTPSTPPYLEIVVEEMGEPVEDITFTPVYRRRRRCVTTMLQTMSQSSVDLDLSEYLSLRSWSLTEFQPSRQALETVWEVESEPEALDVRDSNLLTVDSRDDELLTPPDSPTGRTRDIQSVAYAKSKNDYSGNMEKFEKIMERMGQLHRETSDLGGGEVWRESRVDLDATGNIDTVSNNA